jgi:energy-coupling factor transporter ATP-binding protein EcfA2
MLTRLEIDNFRCFEGFVWEPARKQLILGANGCGKSSMMDALSNLRRFVAGDAKVEELFLLRDRTRWLRRPEQKFALQATVDKATFTYSLVIGTTRDPPTPILKLETLSCDGVQLAKFEQGTVTVNQSGLEPDGLLPLSVLQSSYRLDSSRSAISSVGERGAGELVHAFRRWLNTLYCFRLNPFKMDSRAEGEDADPKLDLSNFAAWYRSLYQSHQKRAFALSKSLEETLDGFDSVVLRDAAEGVRLFGVRFTHKDGNPVEFRFNELSEGQRCLVCLYTILHFVVVEGRTIVIDEPESFIGLCELQPWLKTASRMVSEANGQLILISHNPELIDQWAPRHGVRFVREGMTPVKVQPWHGDPESGLSPAELVARGWDDA